MKAIFRFCKAISLANLGIIKVTNLAFFIMTNSSKRVFNATDPDKATALFDALLNDDVVIIPIGLPAAGKSELKSILGYLLGETNMAVASLDDLINQYALLNSISFLRANNLHHSAEGRMRIKNPQTQGNMDVDIQYGFHQIMEDTIALGIKSHSLVFIDNNHTALNHRQDTIAQARQIGAKTIIGIFLNTDQNTCLQRAATRKHYVPGESAKRSITRHAFQLGMAAINPNDFDYFFEITDNLAFEAELFEAYTYNRKLQTQLAERFYNTIPVAPPYLGYKCLSL